MVLNFCGRNYKCDKVTICDIELYKGKQLFKNGNLGKKNHYFPVGQSYYKISEA